MLVLFNYLKKCLDRKHYGFKAFFEMFVYMSIPPALVIIAVVLSLQGLLYGWNLTMMVVVYGFLMEVLRRRLKDFYITKDILNQVTEENEKYKKQLKRSKLMRSMKS